MKHLDCYEHFGVTPKNVRWSWSAKNDKLVVIVAWSDHFGVSPEGKPGYYHQYFTARDLKLPGYKEMIENLKTAVDKFDGKFHVILADAIDRRAVTRKIANSAPTKLVMKIIKFDELNGELEAQVT